MVDKKHQKLDGFQLRKQYDDELKILEQRIGRLRALWDQYFMGLEKIPPTMVQSELERMFSRSQIPKSRFTLHKFKYRTFLARFTTMRNYWTRIHRKIENGEIRRGVMGRAEISGLSEDIKNEMLKEEEKLPLSAQGRKNSKDRLKGLTNLGGERDSQLKLDEQQPSQYKPHEIQQIFNELHSKKLARGEEVDKLSPERLGKSIQKILNQYPNKDIRLKVTEKKGKITLVAVAKKSSE
jgi:hypothetical protein